MIKDKIRLILMVILLGTFIAGWLLWLYLDWSNTGFNKELVILSVPLLIITITTIMVIAMMYKSVKRNLPMEDEMSKRVKFKAAAYAFYISIYYLLVLGYFGDAYFERPSQATGAGIIGMALIFLVLWVYYNKKGDINN